MFFFFMIRPPPRSTRTDTLLPYTALFRSGGAAMLDGDALDAAREVGLPACLRTRHRVDRLALVVGEVFVPAELLEHLHGELGIAVLDLRTGRVGTFGQQVLAVAFDTIAGTERKSALGHRHRRVPQDRRPRMFHLRGAPARPGP